MAFVRGVMRASTWPGSMSSVSGSTSAKTGVAPRKAAQLALAAKVMVVTITSSPGPDAQGVHGGVQRGGAGAYGHGLGRARHGRQGPFELGNLRSRGQPVGSQVSDHRGHVVLADRLPSVGQQPVADGVAAVNG